MEIFVKNVCNITNLKLRLQITKCVKRSTDITRLTYYKIFVNLRNSHNLLLLILTALFIILLRVNYSNAHSDQVTRNACRNVCAVADWRESGFTKMAGKRDKNDRIERW